MHPRHPPPVFDRGARMVGYGPPGALQQPGRVKLGLFRIYPQRSNIHRTWISSKVKKEEGGQPAITDMPERPPLRRVRPISRANALRTKSDNDKPHICAASRMTAISDGVTYAEQRTLFVSPIVTGRPRPRLGYCMAQMSFIRLSMRSIMAIMCFISRSWASFAIS